MLVCCHMQALAADLSNSEQQLEEVKAERDNFSTELRGTSQELSALHGKLSNTQSEMATQRREMEDEVCSNHPS